MKYWSIVFRLVTLFALLPKANAHSNEQDSLWRVVDTVQNDVIKTEALNELAFIYFRFDPDSASLIAGEALKLSTEIKYGDGQAGAHRMLGIVHSTKADYVQALSEFQLALDSYVSTKNLSGQGAVHNNFGLTYQALGELPKAVDSYSKAHAIGIDLDDKYLLAKVYNNMGIVLDIIGEYDSAINSFYKSLELKATPTNHPLVAATYTNIGLAKFKLKNYEEAEKNYLKSMDISIHTDDKWGVANSMENIGELKFEIGDFEEAEDHFLHARAQFIELQDKRRIAANDRFLALSYYQKGNYQAALEKLEIALKLFTEIGDKRGMALSLQSMALCKRQLNQIQEAIELAKKSLAITTKMGEIFESLETVSILHELYAQQGQNKKAYDYALMQIAYKDSLFNNQRIEYITQLESKNRLSKAKQENELLIKENQLRVNELEATNLKMQKQNIILIALFVCLIFAVIAAGFWYRYNLKKQKTIMLLKRLNDEIISQKEQIGNQADELEMVNGEMKKMNESLEYLVKERTKKIRSQNKKLREYAFANSHEVRAPLSNLLGLVNISKVEGLTAKEQREIIEKIYISALDLDSIITKVNAILEEEEL